MLLAFGHVSYIINNNSNTCNLMLCLCLFFVVLLSVICLCLHFLACVRMPCHARSGSHPKNTAQNNGGGVSIV